MLHHGCLIVLGNSPLYARGRPVARPRTPRRARGSQEDPASEMSNACARLPPVLMGKPDRARGHWQQSRQALSGGPTGPHVFNLARLRAALSSYLRAHVAQRTLPGRLPAPQSDI